VVFIKIDPDVRLGTGQSAEQDTLGDKTGYAVVGDLERLGWQYSHEQVQFKNTVQIDLSLDQDQLRARMKPKTRYNIRLAGRKGVKIRKGDVQDIPVLYQLYLETSVRDDFVIREKAYYQEVWSKFLASDLADTFLAEVDGKAVAGLILFRFAGKAWFLFGMSGSEDREKMPNYLLQWEAILSLKASGCKIYDLWGAPDEFIETDPLWCVPLQGRSGE
jgi:lipid II:glycine glycyltransferase (peptidoglycan interpeptide bridge formation enzyme)